MSLPGKSALGTAAEARGEAQALGQSDWVLAWVTTYHSHTCLNWAAQVAEKRGNWRMSSAILRNAKLDRGGS